MTLMLCILFYYIQQISCNRTVLCESAFMLGKSTISNIVRDTCRVLWEVLHGMVMAKPTKEAWLDIAHLFEREMQLPQLYRGN